MPKNGILSLSGTNLGPWTIQARRIPIVDSKMSSWFSKIGLLKANRVGLSMAMPRRLQEQSVDTNYGVVQCKAIIVVHGLFGFVEKRNIKYSEKIATWAAFGFKGRRWWIVTRCQVVWLSLFCCFFLFLLVKTHRFI